MTSLEKIPITSCFISAPFGFDLNIFREIFSEHNIIITNQSLLKLGESFPESIKKAITRSDLLCAIIPNNANTNNIFFEIGLAYAKNKQILLFVGKNVDLPLELKALPCSTSNFEDRDSLKLYIDSFLNFGTIKKERTAIKQTKRSINLTVIDNEQNEIRRNEGREFEKNIENFFRDAGYLTDSKGNITDKQIDIALWIDKFETFFGNPILVEVKYGNLNEIILKNCENHLREQMVKTGGHLGLIVYNDNQGRQFTEISRDSPLIIKFSSDELANLLKTNKFERKILEIRNNIAHRLA